MCRSCSLQHTLRRKVNALSMQYRNGPLKQLWLGFTDWLIEENNVSNALAKLPGYAATLAKVDRVLNESKLVENEHLAAALTAGDLQRSGLLASYLGSVGVLKSGNAERAAWSDGKRLTAAVTAVQHQPWAKVIDEYAVHLAAPRRMVSVRTQRIYLRSAIALMEFAGMDRVSKLTDQILADFVRKLPGHRASLSAWLRFLQETYQISRMLPKKRVITSKSLKAQVTAVATLLKALDSGLSARAKMAFLAKLLSLLYAIPLETVLHLSYADVLDNEGKISLKLGGRWIDLDSRVEKWVRWLLLENISDNSGYVFSGRRTGDAWSVSGVIYYL